MFIEDLWDKKREFVEDEIKRIFCVNEKNGDSFIFIGVKKDGRLLFVHQGEQITAIAVGDFDIKTDSSDKDYLSSEASREWRRVMKGQIGDKYVYHFFAYRNKHLDAYVDKFNKETADAASEMGFGSDKG